MNKRMARRINAYRVIVVPVANSSIADILPQAGDRHWQKRRSPLLRQHVHKSGIRLRLQHFNRTIETDEGRTPVVAATGVSDNHVSGVQPSLRHEQPWGARQHLVRRRWRRYAVEGALLRQDGTIRIVRQLRAVEDELAAELLVFQDRIVDRVAGRLKVARDINRCCFICKSHSFRSQLL